MKMKEMKRWEPYNHRNKKRKD